MCHQVSSLYDYAHGLGSLSNLPQCWLLQSGPRLIRLGIGIEQLLGIEKSEAPTETHVCGS